MTGEHDTSVSRDSRGHPGFGFAGAFVLPGAGCQGTQNSDMGL